MDSLPERGPPFRNHTVIPLLDPNSQQPGTRCSGELLRSIGEVFDVTKTCPRCYVANRYGDDTGSRDWCRENIKVHPRRRRNHKYREVQLHRQFRHQGLQVYVKIQTIELTPDRPRFPGSDWILEGMLNEHIVATSVYTFDQTNVAEALSLQFRVAADFTRENYMFGCSQFQRAFTTFAIDQPIGEIVTRISHFQTVGSVAAPKERLVAFPNVVQYRLNPIELQDPSKPGCVRFLTLCLVDPNYRVVSTKRVVPQDFSWWRRDVFPDDFLSSRGLPAEVRDQIALDAFDSSIFTPEEATSFRARMQKEREDMMADLDYESFSHEYFNRDLIG